MADTPYQATSTCGYNHWSKGKTIQRCKEYKFLKCWEQLFSRLKYIFSWPKWNCNGPNFIYYDYAVINCIPGPHHMGNSGDLGGDLPGDLQSIVSPQTWDLPRGRYFSRKGCKSTTQDVRICCDSDQRRLGLWGGDLPRDLQEKCAPQSQAHLGLYLGHHKVQNWIPGQFPAIPG